MSEKKRFLWLDLLKITACFLVIINHTHGRIYDAASFSGKSILFDAVFFSLCKIAVPLFLMATGFLTLQKEVPAKKTFSRILRILVPFLLISAISYLQAKSTQGSILNFFASIAREPQNVGLWYLYLLLALYLIIPFLAKIVIHSTNRELALFLLIFLILPSALHTLAGFFGITLTETFFDPLFHYSVCFLIAGVYLSRIPLNRLLFSVFSTMFLLCEALCTVITVKKSLSAGYPVYPFDSLTALPVILTALSLFYIFRFLFERKPFKQKSEKFISELSATCFGVYLIHLFIIPPLFGFSLMQKILQFNPYIGLFVAQIVIFAFSSLFIFLLRKIPVIKSFL